MSRLATDMSRRSEHKCSKYAPAGSLAGGSVRRILLDHDQIGVQRDAHCGVEGDLKGSAHVLRADHGPQLLGVHHLLRFAKEDAEPLNLSLTLALLINKENSLKTSELPL